MTDTKYNGWTNYETWLTNLHFENFEFEEFVEDGTFDSLDREGVKDWIASYIEESVEEYSYEHIELGTPNRLFVTDMIQSFLGEVDWDDIADHYLDDVMQAIENRSEDA